MGNFLSPNSATSITIRGDSDYAEKFRGEATKLIYQVKNIMQGTKLLTYRMTRNFTDGTVITAWSIVNPIANVAHDFANIDVTNSIFALIAECCKKPGASENVGLWWENDTGGESISIVGSPLFKIPHSASVEDLGNFILYSGAEVKETCPPLSWTLSGQGKLTVSADSFSADYEKPEDRCCGENVQIVLKDVCGNPYSVRGEPCCEDHKIDPIEIEYTSLLMYVNDSQTLTVIGGCCPLTWNIVSGDGSLSSTEGRETVYTAPSANPNCAHNPTITVTDCCGNYASITIAITMTGGPAYKQYFYHSGIKRNAVPGVNADYVEVFIEADIRNCDDSYRDYDLCISNYLLPSFYVCGATSGGGGGGFSFVTEDPDYGIMTPNGCFGTIDKWTTYFIGKRTGLPYIIQDYIQLVCSSGPVHGQMDRALACSPDCCVTWPLIYLNSEDSVYPACVPGGNIHPWPVDKSVKDLRTPTMISNGCCPINPETGLPF